METTAKLLEITRTYPKGPIRKFRLIKAFGSALRKIGVDPRQLSCSEIEAEIEKLLPALIERAAKNPDLDAALAPLMDHLDPRNERDLGGEAGVYFADKIEAWGTTSENDRREMLKRFLSSLPK